MNRWGKALATGAFLACFPVPADVNEAPLDRYKTIIDRNPFGLKPAPKPMVPTNGPVTPPSNIKFSGITVEKNGKRAWLVITPAGKQQPEYLSISEGEKQGDLEVVTIDEKESVVNVVQGGTPIKLTFATHGVASTAPKAATMPGVPGMPTPPAARAAIMGFTPAGMPTSAGPTMISRGGVASTFPQGVSGGTPQPNPGMVIQPTTANFGISGANIQINPGGVGTSPVLRAIPTRNLRTQTVPQPPVANVNPEIQAILMQANKVEAESRGIPMPPLPPLPGEQPPPLPGQNYGPR